MTEMMEISAIRKKERKVGLTHIFLLYWGVLVAWQNISGAKARTGVDVIIKAALMILLCAYFILRAKYISKKIIPVFVFAIYMLCAFGFTEDELSLGVIISYAYPVLVVLCVYGIGDKFDITKKELMFFLKGVIVITAYAALWAVIFQPDFFSGALSLQSAYGSELSSFFISSHEYGMYLLYAIVACIICIEMEDKLKRWPYFLAIALFVPNLILTFSRTTIVAAVAIALIYVFIRANARMRKWIVFFLLALVMLAFLSEDIGHFVELVVFKGSKDTTDGNRANLYSEAIEMFFEGDYIQRAFGRGSTLENEFRQRTGNRSAHNAYLQVMVRYGVIGLLFFVGILIAQLKAVVELYSVNKFYSVTFLACVVSGFMIMATNTAIVFISPIDSFFLTVFVIFLPKFVSNAIVAGTFEKEDKKKE